MVVVLGGGGGGVVGIKGRQVYFSPKQYLISSSVMLACSYKFSVLTIYMYGNVWPFNHDSEKFKSSVIQTYHRAHKVKVALF